MSPSSTDLGNGVSTTSTTEAAPSISTCSKKTYTYYHGGPLFTTPELHYNVLLSETISRLSGGKFQARLPQDHEQRETSAHEIRDNDIHALLGCDLALFVFDGPDPDSGTVVELMIAKMADIPAVILRTDFRNAGDQWGAPWNLMCSFWPRTKSIVLNGLWMYKTDVAHAVAVGRNLNGHNHQSLFGDHSRTSAAEQVIAGFEEVMSLPPTLSEGLRTPVYEWLAQMPGFNSGETEENRDRILKHMKSKLSKGLL